MFNWSLTVALCTGVGQTVRVLEYRASKAKEQASAILANISDKIEKLEEAGPMLKEMTEDSLTILRDVDSSGRLIMLKACQMLLINQLYRMVNFFKAAKFIQPIVNFDYWT